MITLSNHGLINPDLINSGYSMFIGREKELKLLQDKYVEEKGQLIVLQGRRHVRKTKVAFGMHPYRGAKIYTYSPNKDRQNDNCLLK